MNSNPEERRYIEEQGREEDVARTRQHFAALVAGLKTAQECAGLLLDRLEAAERERDKWMVDCGRELGRAQDAESALAEVTKSARFLCDEMDARDLPAKVLAARDVLRAALDARPGEQQ